METLLSWSHLEGVPRDRYQHRLDKTYKQETLIAFLTAFVQLPWTHDLCLTCEQDLVDFDARLIILFILMRYFIFLSLVLYVQMLPSIGLPVATMIGTNSVCFKVL